MCLSVESVFLCVYWHKCVPCIRIHTVVQSHLLEILSALGFPHTLGALSLFLHLLLLVFHLPEGLGFSLRPHSCAAGSLGELHQSCGSEDTYADRLTTFYPVRTSSELQTPACGFLLTSPLQCLKDPTHVPAARRLVTPDPRLAPSEGATIYFTHSIYFFLAWFMIYVPNRRNVP